MLGKRKRDTAVARRVTATLPKPKVTENSCPGGSKDVFRKYFEANFEPLLVAEQETPPIRDRYFSDESYVTDEEEWGGISDNEDGPMAVEIIEHRAVTDGNEESLDKAALKSFMGSKPPRADMPLSKQKSVEQKEDDPAESMNLKHDLALQRLLKESHLLEKAKSSINPGSQRHQATDMRLQDLGSKSSLFRQEAMPMSHRRGMATKATTKEVRRRKDAQENGVILERATKISKVVRVKRPLAVDNPGMGKFDGGTLKLSRMDLMKLQSPARGQGKKRRR